MSDSGRQIGDCRHGFFMPEWCVSCLRDKIVGLEKANELLRKGMESQAELMDALKQELRALKTARPK